MRDATLDYVVDLVVKDLREELKSVMNVLIRGGLPFFADIIQRCTEAELSDQMISDLRRLVDNYDIIQHPSASRVYQVLLNSTADIAGFKLRHTEKEPEFVVSDLNFNSINDDFRELLEGLAKLLTRRPHHVALRKMHERLVNMVRDGLNESNYKDFAKQINDIHREYRKCRSSVRDRSREFFTQLCERDVSFGSNERPPYTFLLYGYSELVIKALSGFRDALLNKIFPGCDVKDLYNCAYETRAAQCIN